MKFGLDLALLIIMKRHSDTLIYYWGGKGSGAVSRRIEDSILWFIYIDITSTPFYDTDPCSMYLTTLRLRVLGEGQRWPGT